MILYYQPEIRNEGLYILVFNEEGLEVGFELLPSMHSSNLGYKDMEGNFSIIKEIKSTFTSLDIQELDIENLFFKIEYKDSQNKEDTYKVRNKITLKNLNYKIHFEIVKVPVKVSNLSINRYNYFMPKWSTAYINPISTFSKLFYPSFEQLDNILFKTRLDIKRNILQLPIPTTRKIKKDILKVKQNNTQLSETTSISSSQTSSISLVEVPTPISLFNYTNETVTYPIINSELTSHIYITSNSNVKIKGYDFDNRYIEESLVFTYQTYKMSNFKFKEILIIESDSNFEVSNFIDGISKIQERSLIKFSFFTDREKNYSFNEFRVEENVIKEISRDFEYEPIRKYNINLDTPVSNVILDLTGQVLLLSNNNLYSSVLYTPIDLFPLVHESNNNTSIIDIENDSKIVGEDFSFVIRVQELEEVDYIYLRIESNGKKYYLDNNYNLLEKKEKFFLTSTNNIFVDLKFQLNSYYILNVDTEDNTYTASTYTLTVNPFKLEENIESFFMNNNDIYINKDNKTFKILLWKNNYECSESLVTTESSEPLEVIYTDFTKEVI